MGRLWGLVPPGRKPRRNVHPCGGAWGEDACPHSKSAQNVQFGKPWETSGRKAKGAKAPAGAMSAWLLIKKANRLETAGRKARGLPRAYAPCLPSH